VVTAPERNSSVPPSFSDGWKRIFLGKPLTSEQLDSERLSNPVALGAISPDAISSTAFGPEQVMIELLPRAGMAAFTLLLPIMGVVLFILLLVSASYRGVVMAYTRTGGAYMVARDNFGPRIAQIASTMW
jgi:amino acid transporter